MKWEEMDGLERRRQFKRLRKLFFEALGDYWSKDFAEAETVFEHTTKCEIDPAEAHGGYGGQMQIISDGEWSLICALRGGKANGR